MEGSSVAFALAEAELGLPSRSIRCTVLVETIHAAFEEILYALGDWGCATKSASLPTAPTAVGWNRVLVPVYTEVFDGTFGKRPNQLERRPTRHGGTAVHSRDARRDHGRRRLDQRLRRLSYLDSWLDGADAAAIDNLTEDAGTAEISRSRILQWVRYGRVEEQRRD